MATTLPRKQGPNAESTSQYKLRQCLPQGPSVKEKSSSEATRDTFPPLLRLVGQLLVGRDKRREKCTTVCQREIHFRSATAREDGSPSSVLPQKS